MAHLTQGTYDGSLGCSYCNKLSLLCVEDPSKHLNSHYSVRLARKRNLFHDPRNPTLLHWQEGSEALTLESGWSSSFMAAYAHLGRSPWHLCARLQFTHQCTELKPTSCS